MGADWSCGTFTEENGPDLACPNESLAEDAAVNCMIFTVFGWLIFRCLGQGENVDRGTKCGVSFFLMIYILWQVYYVADRSERPPPGENAPPAIFDDFKG